MNEVLKFSDPGYWEDLVQGGPLRALGEATTALSRGDLPADARLLARRAACRGLFELGRVTEAVEFARAAIAGEPGASDEVRRSATMTGAVILAEAGHVAQALAELSQLAAASSGLTLGRIRLQTACVLTTAGRIDEALTELDASVEPLTKLGDAGDRWRIHHNRGLALLHQGRLDAADSDFAAAYRVATDNGMTMAAAQSVHNRGVLHGRARHPQLAIEHFDLAARLFAECGEPGRSLAWSEIDRAEVMLCLGLATDAVDAAGRAVDHVEEAGNQTVLGDAQLVLARALLSARRWRDAEASAVAAAGQFARTGRPRLVCHAQSVAARARLGRAESIDAVRDEFEAMDALVADLAAAGWEEQELELRYARLVRAHTTGLAQVVPDDVLVLRGDGGEGRARELMRAFAIAAAHYRDGELVGAMASAVGGLDRLDAIVAEARSLEERSAAISLGADLSRLAIDVALERDDAASLFAAAEGTRARALHDELHDDYRHRPLTADGARLLQTEVAEQLGDQVLVEWVICRERVVAVVVDGGGARLVDVADEREVRRARDLVMVSLDMATTEPDASSARALRATRALDELLLSPLGLDDDRGVVFVPVGMLHEVPWAGLPSLASRPVSLAPSAQVWLGADRRAGESADRVAMLSGPDVDGAVLDRESVLYHHPGATVVEGDAATASAARSLFADCGLVHVAAHGRFRSDRPLLSTLRLCEGDATLYDAVPERVGATLIVLSSCEGGAQGTADGSEVLGLSAVMLARGAATVIAPLTAVRDLECADFIADVHAELAAGAMVGHALARVRTRWLGDDDLSRWAVASSFLCFGSGAARVRAVAGAS